MVLFKKISSGMLFKGGIFGTGVLGVYLWRRQHLPQYMGILSMGVTSIGLCSALWDIWKGEDTKQDSYNAEYKEIVDVLYRKVVTQVEEQESQERSEGSTDEEGECQIVNGNEKSAGANHNESESKQPAVPNVANIASAHGSSLQACADNFRQNDVSEADASKVDELPAQASEVPILEDDVDEALAREEAIKELEAKAEKGTKDACEKEGAAGGSTSDDYEGDVFQASTLFKEWDTRRPDIQKELATVNWSAKGANVKKILKGSNTKRSSTGKSN